MLQAILGIVLRFQRHQSLKCVGQITVPYPVLRFLSFQEVHVHTAGQVGLQLLLEPSGMLLQMAIRLI